jgi:hypothetical protein
MAHLAVAYTVMAVRLIERAAGALRQPGAQDAGITKMLRSNN